MARTRFARSASKAGKTTRGRPGVDQSPVSIRSSIPLDGKLPERIRTQLAKRVGHAAGVIERGTVRFDDINGPEGGVDTVCRIKLVVTGRPSIVVEKRDTSPGRAFARAVDAVGIAIERTRAKHDLRAPRRGSVKPSRPARPRNRQADAGELVGRRVGRGPEALARALHRPEKLDRAAYVDTAAPGVSATHRRAGGPTTARRNALARTSRAASTLEDSRTRPSRKSTRRSANRGKPSGAKEHAVAVAVTTPRARAARHR